MDAAIKALAKRQSQSQSSAGSILSRRRASQPLATHKDEAMVPPATREREFVIDSLLV